MILSLADGATNSVVARRYRISRPTVSLWRKRFAAGGYRRAAQRAQARTLTQHRRGRDRNVDQYRADQEAGRQDALVAP
nr:helix-turn-helix domain-containing protein [Xanthomonas oryzae]